MSKREDIIVDNITSFHPEYLAGKTIRIITKQGVIGPPNRKFSKCNKALIDEKNNALNIVWNNSSSIESYRLPFTVQVHGHCKYNNTEFLLFLYSYLKRNSHNLSSYKKGVFILLIGLPGSGKSTLSKKLSKKLGAVHLDYAIICRTYFGCWPTYREDYSLCGEVVNNYVIEMLNKNKAIVYDTTALTKNERDFFQRFSIITNSSYIEIYKNTSAEICRKRLLKERADTAPDLRNNLDYSNDSEYILSFEQLENLFEQPTSSISISDNSMINELIKKLEDFIL